MSKGFPEGASALTHILVVADPIKSKEFYLNVLGADLYAEYGTSMVLEFIGNWLLLVEGGETDRGQADNPVRATEGPELVGPFVHDPSG